MLRHSFALKIKEHQMDNFRESLGKIWSELTSLLDRNEMKNFSLWTVANIVFGYYESNDNFQMSEVDKDRIQKWDRLYGDYYSWISSPFETMKLMYHDFGIVRESKELIRHRVFITKLVDGFEREYKARHDELIRQRGKRLNKGPNSNFSIWYSKGYIFGYNEIDTTMEREKTEEDIISEKNWEIKMLEIMTWLTDDVDWITGECHPCIKRLGWHL